MQILARLMIAHAYVVMPMWTSVLWHRRHEKAHITHTRLAPAFKVCRHFAKAKPSERMFLHGLGMAPMTLEGLIILLRNLRTRPGLLLTKAPHSSSIAYGLHKS